MSEKIQLLFKVEIIELIGIKGFKLAVDFYFNYETGQKYSVFVMRKYKCIELIFSSVYSYKAVVLFKINKIL